MKEAILYALLTVNASGEVHYTRGFETLQTCEIAKSVALYGMTPDEITAEHKRRTDIEAQWKAEHPPRLPQTKDEKREVERVLANYASGTIGYGYTGQTYRVTKNGLIEEFSPFNHSSQMSGSYSSDRGEWVDYDPFGTFVMKNRFSIKTAKCIIEPD